MTLWATDRRVVCAVWGGGRSAASSWVRRDWTSPCDTGRHWRAAVARRQRGPSCPRCRSRTRTRRPYTDTRAQSRRGCLRPARRSDFFLFKHRRQRAGATYMLVKSLQCSRIRILRFFQISKNVNFYVSWNDASKRHKKSLAKVQSSVLRNEFTYFAQRSL